MTPQMLILLNNNISLETIVIAICGYLIVFLALVILFWFFNLLPKLIYFISKRQHARKGKDIIHPDRFKVSGEETAAIAMALHLYLSELHDEESGVLTIKKISKAYSPWSSKIYAVRNQFNRT